jgi:hypothetical protein
MIRYVIISFLIFISVQARSQGCLKDSLISDFVNGKLILINDLSIVNTNDPFFNKLLSLQFTACEVIEPDRGYELYGTLGEKGVISITLFDVEPLRGQFVDLLDASILKHFDIGNPIYYLTNGIPNRDMYMALNSLTNMIIEEVDVVDKAEAQAIWGERARNGAISITCNKTEPLTLFSKK